jgi:polyisoprenoid-binding protein YceI
MATTKWVIDPTHSEIGFKVKHMMFTNVSGKFEKFDATATTEKDDFEGAIIEFSAEVASIFTGNTDRDNHLRSADFFDSEQHPKLSFQSSSMKKITDEAYEIKGILSIRGNEKEVTLNAVYGGIMKDPWGNIKAGFEISGKINRKDWGLNWNAALEAGGVLVSEEVRLSIDVQLVKQ